MGPCEKATLGTGSKDRLWEPVVQELRLFGGEANRLGARERD